jgi:hypothetical protein
MNEVERRDNMLENLLILLNSAALSCTLLGVRFYISFIFMTDYCMYDFKLYLKEYEQKFIFHMQTINLIIC